MAQPATETIAYSNTMMVSERREAVLKLLQRDGELTYWGPREGCYLVVFAEHPGELKALTPTDVDRMEFDEFVRLLGRTT
jgi:hypothetical protein